MIQYFVRHPNAANILMLAAVILGLSVINGMERETFPEFSASRVTVDVMYQGASAIDVDEDICLELDDALGSISGLDDIECTATEGRASATLTMAEGGNINQFYNDILSEVSALNNLPDDAEEPTVSIAAQEEQIALVAISGIDNPESLLRYSDQLAARLKTLSMVSDAKVSGISAQEYRITFDQRALRQYGLSARDVSDAITARSLRQPLGTARTRDREVILRYADIRRSVTELENLVIVQNDAGGFVRLSDIGQVRLVTADPEIKSLIDGDKAAIIQILKTKSDDAIDAFAQVQTLLDAERASLPAPFALTITNDSTENIRDRINLVLGNTAIGLLLVFAVMCLYFSLKEAFWISAALPVSFLGGFFILSSMGITINMISLIAMLMAVGLIMDDSIVIADNIAKWRSKVGVKDASIKGATEVMPGVISSFLTTACVFTPLMFLSGEMGSILEVVPIVLLVVLGISLVEAFLVLPNHLSHVSDDHGKNAKRIAPRLTEKVKETYILPIVRLFVAWRYLVLGLICSALIATVGLITSGTVKVVGFPTTEGDTIEARIALTPGTPLPRTEAVTDRLLSALDRTNSLLTPGTQDGDMLVERVLVRYATNSDVKSNGPHTVTITVDLQSSETRNVTANEVLVHWQQEAGPIPDVSQSSFTQTSVTPGGSDLDVKLASRDLQQLEGATAQLYRTLMGRADVTDGYRDFTSGQAEIALSLTEFGYTVGLTPQSLSNQLRTAFSGSETDSFTDGFTDLTVRVELGDTVPTLSQLEQYPITLPSGGQTALSQVAQIVITESYPQITRQNGQAIARIIGNIDRNAITSGALSQIIMTNYAPALQSDFPNVTVTIGGATEETQETQSSILVAMMVGLVGVYLILAYQFYSYTLPIVVMLSIPFAIIGVVLGHMLVGIDLAMPSFVGFASLAGIVVNNAILFLTFFELETKDDDYLTGVVEAVSHRFRAILLSTTTTFLGLVPIVFETSPQAQTMVPLVTSVAFGLLSSTLLVIFILPAAMAIYFDIFSLRKWMDTRQKLSAPTQVPAE
ncbi:efflux RND transporter permease subunit [Parasulfitobacter algicola]|uniref:Efflux RND transporter permease subunit n=1 Tax=Parasulfitobacter algicola TaxID=2614809 RepID=A0ABX2J0Q0_9RHOB|nr:efflux RND transporter permease subunit [Sulfitobacter algicola]NSX56709.1 efflux RND transporter permease subunit [Sulfitobacter algicola]